MHPHVELDIAAAQAVQHFLQALPNRAAQPHAGTCCAGAGARAAGRRSAAVWGRAGRAPFATASITAACAAIRRACVVEAMTGGIRLSTLPCPTKNGSRRLAAGTCRGSEHGAGGRALRRWVHCPAQQQRRMTTSQPSCGRPRSSASNPAHIFQRRLQPGGQRGAARQRLGAGQRHLVRHMAALLQAGGGRGCQWAPESSRRTPNAFSLQPFMPCIAPPASSSAARAWLKPPMTMRFSGMPASTSCWISVRT